MLNPYFIIGAMIAVGGAYGYGHHVGWGDRDAEMQVEIAKKNEESREKERELAQQLNEQSTKLSEANNVINQKQSSLDRAIRDGRLRLPAKVRNDQALVISSTHLLLDKPSIVCIRVLRDAALSISTRLGAVVSGFISLGSSGYSA